MGLGDWLGGALGTNSQYHQDTPDLSGVQSQYGGMIGGAAQNYNTNAQGQQQFINSLRQQASGQGGPSLAQGFLNQNTQALQQQAAGAIASQRGLNPALAARMTLDQQGQMAQQAAGQGAQMRQQEMMQAQGMLGNALGQQGQQAIGMYGAAGGLQNQQASIQSNAQLGAGQLNAGVSAGNAQANSSLLGGLFGGIASSVGSLLLADGGPIPGFAPVHGDSPANDIVSARLSPGEVVLPRSVMQSADPAGAAHAFVTALRRHKSSGFADGGIASMDYAPPPSPADVPTDMQPQAPQYTPGIGSPGSDAEALALLGAPAARPAATGAPVVGEDAQQFVGRPDAGATDRTSVVLPSGSMASRMAALFPPAEQATTAEQRLAARLAAQDGAPTAPNAAPQSAVAPTGSGVPRDFLQAQTAEQAAAAKQGDLAAQRADAESGIQQAYAKTVQEATQRNQDVNAKRQQAADKMFSDYASQKIDPNRYWSSMDTGSRITSAVSLILGGIGAGLTHGPNMAMQVIDRAIDRDVESQKMNMTKTANALSHYIQESGDIRSAQALAKADARDVAAAQIAAAGAKFGGPQAQAANAALVAQMRKQSVTERLGVTSAITQNQLGQLNLQQAQAQTAYAQQQRAMLNADGGEESGGASSREKLLRLSLAQQADGPAKIEAHTVNVPTDRIIGTDRDGNPIRQTATVPRLAVTPDAATKAREAMISTGMLGSKLAVLERLQKKYPGGTVTNFGNDERRADEQEAKAAIAGLKESFDRGFNLVNAQPSRETTELTSEMMANPMDFLQSRGKVAGGLSFLRKELAGLQSSINRAYLIPRKSD